MLPLNSPRWSTLEHAYGAAGDVPAALAALRAGDEAALGDLFGSIAHQGSVYSASLAAVPHVVDIADVTVDPTRRANVLGLVGVIVVGVDAGLLDAAATDVREAYAASLPRALAQALATLQEDLDANTAVYLLETAAALDGYTTLGRVLEGFVNEEFNLACPACAAELYVWPVGDRLTVAAEDPVSVPETPRHPLQPGPVAGSPFEAEFRWLLKVGGPAALGAIGPLLPSFYGSGQCPVCGGPFVLRTELN